MTRKIFQLCVVVLTAAIFSLATTSVASAGTIVFSSPEDDAVLKVAPSIEWSTTGTITPDVECQLEFELAVIYAFQPCDSSPFSAGSVVNGGSLDWTTGPVPDFGDGEYKFSVSVNFSPDPPVIEFVTFKRDIVKPVVTIAAPTTPTNDNTPTFSFNVDDENLDTVECALAAPTTPPADVSTYGPCTTPTSFTPATPIADGPIAFYVRATDKAGTPGYAAKSIQIDTVAPIITVVSPTPGMTMDSSAPELNFSAIDPAPGTGVVQPIQCRYNVEAFVPCDAAFTSRTLLDGAYTLGVMATDNAGNTAVSSTPFIVATSLDDIDDPTTPARVRAKKLSGKVKGSKYRLKLRGSFAVPRGFDPKVACKGRVRFSIKGRLKGKKAKTFTKKPKLKASRRTCVYTATFSIPKGYKRKRLTTRTVFRGNTLFGGFSKTATIRRA